MTERDLISLWEELEPGQLRTAWLGPDLTPDDFTQDGALDGRDRALLLAAAILSRMASGTVTEIKGRDERLPA